MSLLNKIKVHIWGEIILGKRSNKGYIPEVDRCLVFRGIEKSVWPKESKGRKSGQSSWQGPDNTGLVIQGFSVLALLYFDPDNFCCEGCLMHCRLISSISSIFDPCPPAIETPFHVITKMLLDFGKCPRRHIVSGSELLLQPIQSPFYLFYVIQDYWPFHREVARYDGHYIKDHTRHGGMKGGQWGNNSRDPGEI